MSKTDFDDSDWTCGLFVHLNCKFLWFELCVECPLELVTDQILTSVPRKDRDLRQLRGVILRLLAVVVGQKLVVPHNLNLWKSFVLVVRIHVLPNILVDGNLLGLDENELRLQLGFADALEAGFTACRF